MANQGKISTKLLLEGANEYNNGLKTVRSNLTELRSELKVCQTQYATTQNTAEALGAKEAILAKAHEEATRKVEIYSKAIADAGNEMKKIEDSIVELNKDYDEQKTILMEMEAAGKAGTEEYKSQKVAIDAIKDSLEDANSKYAFAQSEITKYTTYLNNATAEELDYNNQLQATRQYLDEAKSSSDGCAKSIDNMGKTSKSAGENLGDIEKGLNTIIQNEAFQKLNEAAQKVTESFKECAEVAESFETSIAKVQSIAQVSGTELDGMSADIRRVAVEMGYSANEIAEATYQAISASVDASEAIGFVEDATKLARAGFTEASMAVDVLTTATNAYGKEANTTQHIADDLITTQNLGKTTVDELAQSLGTVIPTASAYNVSLDQLSSAYVILTRNGINTANATTYLNGMMTELADDGSKVADILYNKTGHSFGELMQSGYSLGDVMQILGDEVNGNSEAFANLFSNVRAGRGALNIFNAGADEFNSVMKTMETNTGATNKAFEIMADTAEMTNQKFEASVENVKIALGESLSPILQDIKEKGIEVLEPITDFIENNPQLVAAIMGAATGVVTFTTAITAATAAMAIFNTVMKSNPIALVVAGVGLALGAIGGLALSVATASSEISELNSKLQDNIDATNNINQSSAEHIASSQKQAQYTSELKNRLKELNDIQKLDNEQKYEVKKIVSELNSIYPDLNLLIDSQTGKVVGNTEAWMDNIEQQERLAELSYVQEQYNEIINQQAENEYELWEAEQRLAEIEEERAGLKDELNEYYSRSNSLTREQTGAFEELQDKVATLNDEERALKERQEELTGANAELSETYDNLSEYMEETLGITEDSIGTNEEYAEGLDAIASSAKAAEEAENARKEAIEDATAAIENQTGILDDWNTKSQATFDEMQKKWSGQSEGLDQYTADLEVAKGYMEGDFDPALKDLVASMVELDDAATLHTFIEGLQESGTNLEDLTKQWQELIDKKEGASELYAEILLAEQGFIDESNLAMQDYKDNHISEQETLYATEMENAETHKLDMVTMAAGTVTDMAEAITTQTGAALTPAVSNMATETLNTAKTALEINAERSEAFVRIGNDGVCGGLAEGIRQGTSAVKAAIDEMVAQAVASVNISSMVSAIDQRLGEALGG